MKTLYLFQDNMRCNDDEGNKLFESISDDSKDSNDEVVDCYTALNYSQEVLGSNNTDMICEKTILELVINLTRETSQNIPRSFSDYSDTKFKDACCCTCQKGLVI